MKQPLTQGCVAMISVDLIPSAHRIKFLRGSVSVVVDEIGEKCATVRYVGVRGGRGVGGFSVPLDALNPIRVGSPPDDRGMDLWNGINKAYETLTSYPGLLPSEVTDLALLGELVFDARRYLSPQFLSVDLVELAHEVRRFLELRRKSDSENG